MFTIDKLSNISLGKNSIFEIAKQAKDAENKHGKAAVITSTLVHSMTMMENFTHLMLLKKPIRV